MLPTVGPPAFDLSCVTRGVSQPGVLNPCKPSCSGVTERWKSGDEERLRKEAADNHFKDEAAGPTRLTPES